MKAFIDCGAHDGCSVRKFLDTVEDASEYEIFSFEPNPSLRHYHPVGNATFYDKAVWIRYGTIEFYQWDKTGGSSLFSEKSKNNERKLDKNAYWQTKLKPPEKIKVDCIDFDDWVRWRFKKDDYIILKMDIEGSEYDVLEKMVENNTIEYINEMWIEWHFTTNPKTQAWVDSIIESISKYEVKFVEWDAMHEPYLIEKNCTEHKDFYDDNV